MPIRTADGALVGKAVLFAAGDPATPQEGESVAGPIRTADGALVGRTAIYQVTGGVAVPATIVSPDSVGQPGGPAGPLDGEGHLPTDQIPPSLLHTTFEATSEAEMLAEPAMAPSLCVRTDQTPPHIWFLHADPATDLANWKDLGGLVSAGDDPSAQIGLVAVNGAAATFMRSDAAPALDQSISPAWTGAHDFQAVSTQSTPSVGINSTDPQLDLRRSSSATDEKRWNFRVYPDQLRLSALTDAGDVADTAWLITRSQGQVTAHSIQAGGDPLLELSAASGLVASADLHMSNLRIMELADPQQDTDAVNQQTLNAAVGNLPVVRDSGSVALHLDGEELLWPTDVTNGKLRLYNSTPGSNNDFYGLGVENGAQIYQVDSDTSVHRFQGVDDSDNALTIVELSSQGGIVSSVDLHMGEQKVVNLGNPDSARDAANKQYVDGAIAAVNGISTLVTHNSGNGVTLTDTDPEIQLIDAFAASGDFTVTLPGNGTTTGKTFTIKKIDGVTVNAVNITPSDGQQIDGSLNAVSLTAQWSLLTMVFDGANWQITSSHTP